MDPLANADIPGDGPGPAYAPDAVLNDTSIGEEGTFTLTATVSNSGVYTPGSGTISIGSAYQGFTTRIGILSPRQLARGYCCRGI